MLKKKHKGMLDCNGPDKHSCFGCTHWLGGLSGFYCDEIKKEQIIKASEKNLT